MNVAVNISGDKAFMTKLVGVLPALSDLHEGLHDAGKSLVNYFGGQVFESMGGVYGTPWQQLSASTTAFKAKHYRQFANQPLQATGKMRESFEFKAGALSLVITNSADQFKYHQSTEPRSKIPRRQMFGINRDVKEIIRLNIQADMNRKLMAL